MLRRTILFLLIILSVVFGNMAFAQQADSTYIVGKRYTIQSSVLKESRRYWVRLPKDYSPKEKYPVIYVLDGEMYFSIVSAEQGFLDGNNRFANNKSIVVAIENTDRTRDLTPTPSISEKGQATMENSGKGEQFFQFIQKELIPNIERQYGTSNRRIIVGHSFGGLSTTYFLQKHPDCFTDYLIMEPALWWDNDKLLGQAKDDFSKNIYPNNCHVFFAFAKQKDSTNLKDIDNILTATKPKNIILQSQYYPNESHGTIYVHALYDGLRFIFDFASPRERKPPFGPRNRPNKQ